MTTPKERQAIMEAQYNSWLELGLLHTWHPYENFAACAAVLHPDHLSLLRREVLFLVRALDLRTVHKNYENYPGMAMWRHHEPTLIAYGLVVNQIWLQKGGDSRTDHVGLQLMKFLSDGKWNGKPGDVPSWISEPKLQASHQGILKDMKPEHYSMMFPDADPEADWWWPGEIESPPVTEPGILVPAGGGLSVTHSIDTSQSTEQYFDL